MAVTETSVAASPGRCFEVLRDPRSYAYWVVGSKEIRDADADWPAVGSTFHHTSGAGILQSKDETVVEEMEENRKLRFRAKARPFGTAHVTMAMEPEGEGTRVRMEEGPADPLSRLAFNPLADRLLHARNEESLNRFKDLVEGTVPIPPDGRSPSMHEEDHAGGGGSPPSRAAAGFGAGFVAGLIGGVAMSVSTIAEMRITGREPSRLPGRTIERVLAIDRLGRKGEQRASVVAHFLVAGVTAGLWGAASSTVRPAESHSVLFAIATTPELAITPALGLSPPPWRWTAADAGRTVLHHAVYTIVTRRAFIALEN